MKCHFCHQSGTVKYEDRSRTYLCQHCPNIVGFNDGYTWIKTTLGANTYLMEWELETDLNLGPNRVRLYCREQSVVGAGGWKMIYHSTDAADTINPTNVISKIKTILMFS